MQSATVATVSPALNTAPTSTVAPTQVVTTPKTDTVTEPSGSVSLSGRSISSIILQTSTTVAPSVEEVKVTEKTTVAIGETEAALIAGCAKFSQELMQERPRISILFQDAQVNGTHINLTVSNESSYDELMHSLTDIKTRLSELSGVRVPIEFNVTIKTGPKELKPIKAEDRWRYLTDKNPLLPLLRKELDMEMD